MTLFSLIPDSKRPGGQQKSVRFVKPSCSKSQSPCRPSTASIPLQRTSKFHKQHLVQPLGMRQYSMLPAPQITPLTIPGPAVRFAHFGLLKKRSSLNTCLFCCGFRGRYLSPRYHRHPELMNRPSFFEGIWRRACLLVCCVSWPSQWHPTSPKRLRVCSISSRPRYLLCPPTCEPVV